MAQKAYSVQGESCLLLTLLCWVISKASLTLTLNDP